MKQQSLGFSLLELSILLTVISIIAAGMLGSTLVGQSIKARQVTVDHMLAIEEAVRNYIVVNSKLPCPAEGNAVVGTSAFGAEDLGPAVSNPGGRCFEPDLFSVGQVIIGGAVPTRELNLRDEIAFDGWGNRITYVVDEAATDAYTLGSSGAVQIYPTTWTPANSGKTASTAVMVLVSHGPNGHGAFPGYSGSFAGARISVATADVYQQANAGSASGLLGNVYYPMDKNDMAGYPAQTQNPDFDDVLHVTERFQQ